MLTPATDDAKELAQLCQGRFTGDPSHEFEVSKYTITSEDTEEENIEEYKVIKIDLIVFYMKMIFFRHNYGKKNDWLLHYGKLNKML